jgi:hypothetical protein
MQPFSVARSADGEHMVVEAGEEAAGVGFVWQFYCVVTDVDPNWLWPWRQLHAECAWAQRLGRRGAGPTARSRV